MKLMTTCWTFDEFEDSEVYKIHTSNPYTFEKEMITLAPTETIQAILDSLRDFANSKECVLLNDGSLVYYGDDGIDLDYLRREIISWGEMTINTVLVELEEEYWHEWEKESGWQPWDNEWVPGDQCYDVCF